MQPSQEQLSQEQPSQEKLSQEQQSQEQQNQEQQSQEQLSQEQQGQEQLSQEQLGKEQPLPQRAAARVPPFYSLPLNREIVQGTTMFHAPSPKTVVLCNPII